VGDAVGFYASLGVPLHTTRDSGWAAIRCFLPGHEDKHKSASVSTQHGGWRCFTCDRSGGPWDAAIALGRSRQDAAELCKRFDLWLENERTPAPRVDWQAALPKSTAIDWNAAFANREPRKKTIRERTWTYTDATGVDLFRTCRRDYEDGSKHVWQERLEDGEWRSGIRDVPRVLFRLPAVLERATAGGLVLLVEGEKACDALARLDVFATTSPMGAGKWRDEYALALAGAHVVVCPDCDAPGRAHMATASRSLIAKGVQVYGPLELLITRSDGYDLVDHLAEVAATCRAVMPGMSEAGLRKRLRAYLGRLVRACTPATMASLRAYDERGEFHAHPDGSVLLFCERCGRKRPHKVIAGISYCRCGALAI
jgi:hypothetical protein